MEKKFFYKGELRACIRLLLPQISFLDGVFKLYFLEFGSKWVPRIPIIFI